jgi:membrane protease YdiL (CAAX protease family)
MIATRPADGRLRAYAHFITALFYYFLAGALARRGAAGLASDRWAPFVDQAMLAFLLLLGYAGLGFTLNRQQHPVSEQGLPRRKGWQSETATGMAIGWATALICVLIMALDGGIAIRLSLQLSAWGWLLVEAAFFALLALAEEVAFRGYGFQRFARAVGPVGAALGFALLYAFLQAFQPGSNHASITVSFLLSLLLSTAYWRTRALWVSWGINFGWKASRALLFGLTVSGINSHSPVVQGDPMGPFWLTGGGFGLDGSWITFIVLLAIFPVVFRATRDLNFYYNAPEFVAGGIPVDLDAAARRQHEDAMGPAEPAAPILVQILPLASPDSSPAISRLPDSEATKPGLGDSQ